MIICLRFVRVDTTGQHDHRHAILLGIRDNVDTIHRARTDGRHKNGRRIVDMICTFGHESGGILVMAQGEFDPSRLQRVDQGQHLTSGDAESTATTGKVEASGKGVGGANGAHCAAISPLGPASNVPDRCDSFLSRT